LSRPQRKPSEPSPKRRKRSGVPVGWVEVAVAPDRIAGGMLESALKAEGIPVMLQNPIMPILGTGGQHRVVVPAEHADQARAVLRDIWDQPE
jgi:Putative prokaryotic signal transducing protein